MAEAFERYGQAAILDLIAKMLPELAAKVAEPMTRIDKITVVDSGQGGDGAAKVSNYVTRLMAQAPEMVSQVSGLDINALMKQASQPNHVPNRLERDSHTSESVGETADDHR